MTRVIVCLLVLCSAVLAGCARPGTEQCEKACLHYIELFLEEQWAGKLAAAASTQEREQVLRDKEAERQDLKNNPSRGFNNCLARCNRPARQGAVDCMLKARTLAEAKACDN